jgi:mannose-6-phosphate isomerase-like protein (cupin superfamily)
VADDVTMTVLDGALVVTGLAGDVPVRAGETLVLRHGTPFAWRNASAEEPAVYLAVYAPGGFEEYFVAVADALAAGSALTPELLGPLWNRFGIAVSE